MKEFELSDYLRIESRLLMIDRDGEFVFTRYTDDVKEEIEESYNYYLDPIYADGRIINQCSVCLRIIAFRRKINAFKGGNFWLIHLGFYGNDTALILGE